MKRNVIVEKLIKEGFSEKTLVRFSDKQLSQLFERVISEVTTQVATVYNAKDPNDVNDLNALISNPAGLAAAQKKGAVKVQSSEGEEIETKQKGSKKNSKQVKSIGKKPSEVKEWVKSLAEENFHNFTSKNEIMELINSKLNESEKHEFGANVKTGHNGLPEFMTYDAIVSNNPKIAPSKPKVDPGTKPNKPKTPFRPGPRVNPNPIATIKGDKK